MQNNYNPSKTLGVRKAPRDGGNALAGSRTHGCTMAGSDVATLTPLLFDDHWQSVNYMMDILAGRRPCLVSHLTHRPLLRLDGNPMAVEKLTLLTRSKVEEE